MYLELEVFINCTETRHLKIKLGATEEWGGRGGGLQLLKFYRVVAIPVVKNHNISPFSVPIDCDSIWV